MQVKLSNRGIGFHPHVITSHRKGRCHPKTGLRRRYAPRNDTTLAVYYLRTTLLDLLHHVH